MNSSTIEPILPSPSDATFGPASFDSSLRKAKIALCLRRGASAGFRIIVLSPEDTDEPVPMPFQGGGLPADALLRHAGPQYLRSEIAAYWATARRVFLRAGDTPHDRVSWHVLVVDRGGMVVGTISARLFAEDLPISELRILTLAEAAGPIFREQCELAIRESCGEAQKTGRTVGELSDWSIAPGPHRRTVITILIRATAALAAAFGNPLWIFPANHYRRHVTPLLRRGAAPLGRVGKFCLPPLIDHRTAAWLRILLIDTAGFHARSGTDPATEWAVLRRRATLMA